MELERKLDEVDRVVNKLKFDLLKDLLINSKITSVDTLQRVAILIHANAIAEPSLCSMYAQLCSDLIKKLPSFPSDDYFISFKRLLLNKCQETFEQFLYTDLERWTKPHFIGNICFISELYMQKLLTERIVHEVIKVLLSPDSKECLEVKVEALCQLLNVVGKQLVHPGSRDHMDAYFGMLKKLSSDQHLSPHVRSMVLDVINLRSNNWVPKQEKVKAKSIIEIHVDVDNMQLRLGSTAASKGAMAGVTQGSLRRKGGRSRWKPKVNKQKQ